MVAMTLKEQIAMSVRLRLKQKRSNLLCELSEAYSREASAEVIAEIKQRLQQVEDELKPK
jgi:ABC-type phosphate transport system auxiliary subunit